MTLTKADIMAESQRWEVEKREASRAQRHHEVLCLVLQELAAIEARHDTGSMNAAACVSIARAFADAAYPPPKEQA